MSNSSIWLPGNIQARIQRLKTWSSIFATEKAETCNHILSYPQIFYHLVIVHHHVSVFTNWFQSSSCLRDLILGRQANDLQGVDHSSSCSECIIELDWRSLSLEAFQPLAADLDADDTLREGRSRWSHHQVGLDCICSMFDILCWWLYTRRYNASTVSNAENEPYLIAAATALTYLTTPSPVALAILYTGFACRVVHSVSFLYKIQPLRTFSFVGGVVATTALTVIAATNFKLWVEFLKMNWE